MLNWLKERQGRARTAQQLYGSIVAQARQPGFYERLGVPDTTRGRFELIALHVALVIHRLQAADTTGADLARSLGETFVVDMDDNMREMSFSDLAVPREVKKAAAALFDRHTLLTALTTPPPAQGRDPVAERLEKALAYLAAEQAEGVKLDADALASYLRAASAMLQAQAVPALLEQGPQWPALQA
jgi:cytochrome b pre-mRNA-processing protein 3